MAHDTSGSMDIEQVKGVKGKDKKGKDKKGEGKGKTKTRKIMMKRKESAQTDDSYFAGEFGYCGKRRHKKTQCRKQKKDQRGKSPAATVQAIATVIQIQSFSSDGDPFWEFAVTASSGRNARTLLDSEADEHVYREDFVSATPLRPTKGDTLHDVQGYMIEVHGTRIVHMRPGPEGQSVDAEFRVTNVKSPILSMVKLIKQGYQFGAGPARCKVSKGDRSVTLDIVKNFLWVEVRAYTTDEGGRPVASVVTELLLDPTIVKPRPDHTKFQTARAPRGP